MLCCADKQMIFFVVVAVVQRHRAVKPSTRTIIHSAANERTTI